MLNPAKADLGHDFTAAAAHARRRRRSRLFDHRTTPRHPVRGGGSGPTAYGRHHWPGCTQLGPPVRSVPHGAEVQQGCLGDPTLLLLGDALLRHALTERLVLRWSPTTVGTAEAAAWTSVTVSPVPNLREDPRSAQAVRWSASRAPLRVRKPEAAAIYHGPPEKMMSAGEVLAGLRPRRRHLRCRSARPRTLRHASATPRASSASAGIDFERPCALVDNVSDGSVTDLDPTTPEAVTAIIASAGLHLAGGPPRTPRRRSQVRLPHARHLRRNCASALGRFEASSGSTLVDDTVEAMRRASEQRWRPAAEVDKAACSAAPRIPSSGQDDYA